jgi:hypothetical protein
MQGDCWGHFQGEKYASYEAGNIIYKLQFKDPNDQIFSNDYFQER